MNLFLIGNPKLKRAVNRLVSIALLRIRRADNVGGAIDFLESPLLGIRFSNNVCRTIDGLVGFTLLFWGKGFKLLGGWHALGDVVGASSWGCDGRGGKESHEAKGDVGETHVDD